MSEEITITDGMPTEQPVQAETTMETVPVVEEQVVVEAPVAEQAAAVQETASDSTTPVVIAIPTPEEAAAAEAARIAAKEERERKRAEEQARRQKEQEGRYAQKTGALPRLASMEGLAPREGRHLLFPNGRAIPPTGGGPNGRGEAWVGMPKGLQGWPIAVRWGSGGKRRRKHCFILIIF